VAAWRAPLVASRARVRSRMAASSTVGPSTGVRAPARLSRARGTASRRSVCTRAPAFVGIQAGATTPHCSPVLVKARSSQDPQGPASSTQTSGVAVDGRVRTRGSRSHGRVPMVPSEVPSAP
jgi:hypothetical protein